MTETPEEQPEQTIAGDPGAGEAEPMYGPEDVARALHTSGQRALAHSYFDKMGAAAANGIPQSEAEAMIAAIEAGQPYPPGVEINPLEPGEMKSETMPDDAPPPEGAA